MEKKFDIDKIVLIGRGFNEYMMMFNLDLNYLKDKKVLDCPAGASSFTAELSSKGYDVTACDVLYDLDPGILEKKCKEDILKVMQSLSGVEDMYVWDFFKSPDELIKHRTGTYRTFIKDYQKERGIYIKSELPRLPFKDNEFSLILSSHFLFLYDDRLNYRFHRNSIQEMLRVSEEIRIFPLVGLNGRRSLFVDKIIEDMAGSADMEISKVPYEFMNGANEMLGITR